MPMISSRITCFDISANELILPGRILHYILTDNFNAVLYYRKSIAKIGMIN